MKKQHSILLLILGCVLIISLAFYASKIAPRDATGPDYPDLSFALPDGFKKSGTDKDIFLHRTDHPYETEFGTTFSDIEFHFEIGSFEDLYGSGLGTEQQARTVEGRHARVFDFYAYDGTARMIAVPLEEYLLTIKTYGDHNLSQLEDILAGLEIDE